MTRSVKVATPIPSLEEFGKSLGLSKAKQNSLIRIVTGSNAFRRRNGRGVTVASLRRQNCDGKSAIAGIVLRSIAEITFSVE
jgi:hypothetical protein